MSKKYHGIAKCPQEKCLYWGIIWNISNPMHSDVGCQSPQGCIRDYRELKDEFKQERGKRCEILPIFDTND